MKSSRTRWIRGLGAVVLVGGLMITGWGLGVTSAAPPASNPGNPFQAILDKLDQVLAAVTGAAGQGNHTLRWDTNNPSATRFTVLAAIPGAVLDKNTGLVWEQAPDGTPPRLGRRHSRLRNPLLCQQGCRGHSRLATALGGGAQERAGWLDGSGRAVCPGQRFHPQHQQCYSRCPVGQLLVGVDDRRPSDRRVERVLRLGLVFSSNKANGSVRAWCVRGGMHADTY